MILLNIFPSPSMQFPRQEEEEEERREVARGDGRRTKVCLCLYSFIFIFLSPYFHFFPMLPLSSFPSSTFLHSSFPFFLHSFLHSHSFVPSFNSSGFLRFSLPPPPLSVSHVLLPISIILPSILLSESFLSLLLRFRCTREHCEARIHNR